MHSLFVSDLHLCPSRPAINRIFFDFLRGPATQAEALYILGDLFEFWAGDDDDTDFHRDVIGGLRALSVRGVRILLMHGNRDFLVGSDFLGHCETQFLQDPTVLAFASERWLLTHGDALCLADTDYQQFRQQVRDPAWQQAFLARPLAQRHHIARELREQSQQVQRAAETYADVDAAAACEWLDAAQAGSMIHGHTHRPAVHELEQGRQRWVLSDWDCSAAAPRSQVLRLECANGQTTLRRIAPASA